MVRPISGHLAQLRAIDHGIERITVPLLQTTYDEDLRPIHPMIDALRSGRADKIAQFSDLVIPDIDKKLLTLQSHLQERRAEFDEVSEYQGHEMSIRLHRMLVDIGQESPLLVPTVKKVIQELPNASLSDLIVVVLEWLKDEKLDESISTKKIKLRSSKAKASLLKQKDWHTLDNEDLRFQFSQKNKEEKLYDHLKTSTNLVFDINDWLHKVS